MMLAFLALLGAPYIYDISSLGLMELYYVSEASLDMLEFEA